MTSSPGDDAMFVVGRFGIIEDVNDAALVLTGYTREELVGAHGTLLISADAQPATAVSMDRMRRGEISQQRGRRLRRKDGGEIVIDVRAQVLPGERLALFLRRRSDGE